MENICFFNSTAFWGGGEKLHLENAVEFRKLGYAVTISCKYKSPLWQKATNNGLKTFPITVNNLSFLNPIKLIKLVYFFKSNSIDTVFFSTSEDLKLGAIAAHLAGVKRIVYLRGLAVPIKSSFFNILLFNNILTHIIANSNGTKTNMLKYLGKYVKEEKIKTIYHGITIEEQKNHILEVIKNKSNGIVLGTAGRLTEQKGQNKLIEVAKKISEANINFTLYIAGEGELKPELQKQIEKYHLTNKVILLGHVADMEGFMNSIDIFVFSSIWEGFGFVLVEAMIKQKPVVAFDKSNIPEIVENEKTGFLIKYPDVNDFANKVILLSKDRELREEMGVKGLQRVKENFVLKDKILEIEAYIKASPNL